MGATMTMLMLGTGLRVRDLWVHAGRATMPCRAEVSCVL